MKISYLFTILAMYTANCSHYDLEEESMKLYGVGYKTVLLSLRQTPEYVKILQDKIQEVKHNRAEILSQIKHQFFILMDSAIREHLGYDGETEDFSSIHDTELINSFTENISTNTTINNYIKILDEYSKKRQRQPVKYTNMCKNSGFEYARRAIYTFRKNMGDIGIQERSTKNVFGDVYKETDETTTTTTRKPTTTTTTTTKKPTTTKAPLTATSCNPGYEFFSGTRHCYRFNARGVQWSAAKALCEAEGARLAVPNSAAEEGFLVELFARYPAEKLHNVLSTDRAFVGIYWDPGSRQLRTVDGQSLEEVGYMNWLKVQPIDESDLSKYPYVRMLRDGTIYHWIINGALVFMCEQHEQ